MNKTTTILLVLIAIIIIAIIGVIYVIDLVEDTHQPSFILTFSNFNATDSTISDRGPLFGDITPIGHASINYDKFILLNDPTSRETLLGFRGQGQWFKATLVDGFTDGENFEFTWLVNHSSKYFGGHRFVSTTSEIVVSGKCDVSQILVPGSNSTLIFTTIKGDLVITPAIVPSSGSWSSYSSVCETVP